MAINKPDGWYVDILPIEPPRLAGGERMPVIMAMIVPTFIAILVGPRVGGVYELLTFALAAVVIVLEIRLLRWAWTKDNRLSQVLPRFRSYPPFIQAHASSASSDKARLRQRQKRHLIR